ncbi:hypothetical protein F5Y04DRAFT_247638 [Hypomontagnella monticulosa]|nr:hypothetical protein F5Y04DRAFT_247638 [Hypomontagnella monticulosa]
MVLRYRLLLMVAALAADAFPGGFVMPTPLSLTNYLPDLAFLYYHSSVLAELASSDARPDTTIYDAFFCCQHRETSSPISPTVTSDGL